MWGGGRLERTNGRDEKKDRFVYDVLIGLKGGGELCFLWAGEIIVWGI